jgi:hypothetical protein
VAGLNERRKQLNKEEQNKNKNMKKTTIITMVAAGLALSAVTSQAQLDLDVDGSATFSVSGSTTSFTLNNNLSSSLDPADTSVTGAFSGLGFSFLNTGSSASITGSETMTLSSGGSVSGLLTFANITEVGNDQDGVDIVAVVNYTGLTGSSTDAFLKELLADKAGSFDLTVSTPNNGNGLSQLSGPLAYAGTITPVPEASTVIAGALMLLPLGIGAIRA